MDVNSDLFLWCDRVSRLDLEIDRDLDHLFRAGSSPTHVHKHLSVDWTHLCSEMETHRRLPTTMPCLGLTSDLVQGHISSSRLTVFGGDQCMVSDSPCEPFLLVWRFCVWIIAIYSLFFTVNVTPCELLHFGIVLSYKIWYVCHSVRLSILKHLVTNIAIWT